MESFTSGRDSWYACQTERAYAEAVKWCEEYKMQSKDRRKPSPGGKKLAAPKLSDIERMTSSGGNCRIVKSGQSCPDGFYESERLNVSWGRDYKACLGRKISSQRVKDCSGRATANIEKALEWIDTHYNTILTGFQMQPRETRDRRARARMDRKFPKVTVTCEDHRAACRRTASKGGWSMGALKVHMCYSNLRTFCQLVEVIVHEAAHNAWVDMELSQHIGDPGDRDDTVYQLGFRAADLCTGRDDNGTGIVSPGSRSYDFPL
jgi:hypothetical protein